MKSKPSGAPIRASWASPLRGGDRRRRERVLASPVAAARPPARIHGARTVNNSSPEGLRMTLCPGEKLDSFRTVFYG